MFSIGGVVAIEFAQIESGITDFFLVEFYHFTIVGHDTVYFGLNVGGLSVDGGTPAEGCLIAVVVDAHGLLFNLIGEFYVCIGNSGFAGVGVVGLGVSFKPTVTGAVKAKSAIFTEHERSFRIGNT